MDLIIQINPKKKIFILLSFFFFLNTNAQYVSTFAGSTQGFADGTGSAAQFYQPSGVAVDAAGNVFVVDSSNHRIRKITAAGVVSTFAGSTWGFADGIGTGARFKYPSGVAVDAAGNVFVADRSNNRIRKITAAGEVSTFAGSTQGFADGTGTAAQFYNPTGVAVDAAGNVFVADSYNNRIRKITAAGVVTTLAGSTQGFADGTGTAAQFYYPCGAAVDAAGTVFVAEQFNHRIRKITAAGAVTTLAGNGIAGFADGTGVEAQFNYPYGVAVDAAGNVFITEVYNNRIRKITDAGVVSTLAGSTQGYTDGTGAAAQFYYPCGIALDVAGTVFVGDTNNHRIRKITSALAVANYHQHQVTVYPNPASSMINIELEDIGGATVRIFDMNGRVLQSENIVGDRGVINIGGLGRGIYLMEIITDRGMVCKKIVKE
jgi:hypothetical protein